MKTETQCETFARMKLKEYVNGCGCNSKDDVLNMIQKMLAVCYEARDLVQSGTMETVQ